MSKLNDLKRLARDELEKFADRGLSAQTAESRPPHGGRGLK